MALVPAQPRRVWSVSDGRAPPVDGGRRCHRGLRRNDGEGAQTVAQANDAWSAAVDVSDEAQIFELIEETERQFGPIDLFCSNAGIGLGKGLDESTEVWQKIWEVNTMSHVYAAKHLVPRMTARGGGYLLNTASAAGLLSQIGSVTYAVTKHAAVAAGELDVITHGRDGINGDRKSVV